jgi:hypothetical protein
MVNTDRSEYHKEYYRQHKHSILEARRKKYESDDKYREQAKERFKKRYNKHLRSPSKEIGYTIKKVNGKQLFSIKYVAEMTGLSTIDVRRLEYDGFIPKSLYTDKRGWRLYTEWQVKSITVALSALKKENITKNEAKEFIKKEWRKGI